MKTLVRIYMIHLLAIWFMTYLFSGGFKVDGGLLSYLIGALILTLLNMLLKPILKMLFFPINALTLGLFSLIITIVVFYLFVRLSAFVVISAWTFPGISLGVFILSSYKLNFIETLIIASLFMSLLTNLLMFILK